MEEGGKGGKSAKRKGWMDENREWGEAHQFCGVKMWLVNLGAKGGHESGRGKLQSYYVPPTPADNRSPPHHNPFGGQWNLQASDQQIHEHVDLTRTRPTGTLMCPSPAGFPLAWLLAWAKATRAQAKLTKRLVNIKLSTTRAGKNLAIFSQRFAQSQQKIWFTEAKAAPRGAYMISIAILILVTIASALTTNNKHTPGKLEVETSIFAVFPDRDDCTQPL